MPRREPAAPSDISYQACRSLTPDDLDAMLRGDPQEAARWLGAAARYGVVEAQTAYAQLLLDGRGVARDATAAFAWFSVAAGAGSVEATNMVGRCHENGWGVPADAAAAAPFYRDAAERGYDWAQYNLANLLARGAGLPQDRGQALLWYRRAAAQGHAKSANLIGRFLEEGWEVPPDPGAAALWYRRAAEGGDFRGQFNHGTLLARQGRVAEAATWFGHAVAGGTRGFLRSMARALEQAPEPEFQAIRLRALARCCEGGEAADAFAYAMALRDSGEAEAARSWLQRAAAAGHAEAQAMLRPASRTSMARDRLRRHLARAMAGLARALTRRTVRHAP
ncbi:tetratricopeptide repeat protein [Paracraurococcus lichenis]|uniref:Tetratricopeptide repeat protein n=1 Tax=Paracraurococcus lichenis TaxID=3064888 RepID=A0ABT9E6A1_9PROT|nr:tetratricopeptide repeat protein [Paracraurococcus sp. LOR1-02]MDO9711700.1 tetratricopeptide repeat protein [Paracraurococcus sp. LOR1-02]